MRISTFSSFTRVLLGIQKNQVEGFRAQAQISSGKRVLRASDDPIAAARALGLGTQLASLDRFRKAIGAGLTQVDTAANALQEGSNLLTEAREHLLQGMNGTLAPADREALAAEFDLIRAQLLDLGNSSLGERYLFGGTETQSPPWVEVDGRVV